MSSCVVVLPLLGAKGWLLYDIARTLTVPQKFPLEPQFVGILIALMVPLFLVAFSDCGVIYGLSLAWPAGKWWFRSAIVSVIGNLILAHMFLLLAFTAIFVGSGSVIAVRWCFAATALSWLYLGMIFVTKRAIAAPGPAFPIELNHPK